jgi:hypothetical protein
MQEFFFQIMLATHFFPNKCFSLDEKRKKHVMQVSNILITFYSSNDGYIKIGLRG